MYAHREYLIHGDCPYCGRSFNQIVNDREVKFIHRCSDCSRGLTIVTTKDLLAIVEPSLPVQKIYRVDALTKDCCQ